MGNFESRAGPEFPGAQSLGVDQALLVLQSNVNETTCVFTLSTECHKCDPSLQTTLGPEEAKSLNLNVKFPLEELSIGPYENGSNAILCGGPLPSSQFSVYNCSIFRSDLDDLQCSCQEIYQSSGLYLPIAACAAALLTLAAVYIILSYLYKKISSKCQKSSEIGQFDAEPNAKQRLRSVDVFRGMCITIMIFVNFGGGGYWFFGHSVWNGLLPADLVFPWFVWVMGVCAPIAIRSLQRRKAKTVRVLRKILRRTLVLFAIGLILSNGGQYDLRNLRIMGVLQRIGLAYCYVAILCLTVKFNVEDPEDKPLGALEDLVLLWPQHVVTLVVVAAHLALTFALPVPGCPTGYLGPGGMHDHGLYKNCTGGATGYIDRTVFGYNHMYSSPEITAVYGTLPFEPEGILGCLQTFFLAFLGVQAGTIMLTYKPWLSRVKRWLSWSLITGVIAAVLCKVSKDDGWIPINKNLWSLSFVMGTASLAFLALTICYLLVDVTCFWSGAPFFYAGMNSILIYIGHMVAYNYFPWRWTVSNSSMDTRTHEYELIVSIWATTLWVIISVILYYAKLFLIL